MYSLLFLLNGTSQKKGKYKFFLLERLSRKIIDFFSVPKIKHRLSKNFYRMSCLICFKWCKYKKFSCWENVFRKITKHRVLKQLTHTHTHTQNSLFSHGDHLLLDFVTNQKTSISVWLLLLLIINTVNSVVDPCYSVNQLHHRRNGFVLHSTILTVWLPVIYNKVVLI